MRILRDLTPTPATQSIIYNALDTMRTKELADTFTIILPSWCQEPKRFSALQLGPVMTMMRRGLLVNQDKATKETIARQERHVLVQKNFDALCIALF